MAVPSRAVEHALDLLFPPVDPHQTDPAGFATDILGFTPWSKQVQIMESVRNHERTAVRACHGVGKTASAAQIALWFLATHTDSRVITTAPTWAQVEQLLWREIRAAVARAHAAGRGTVFPKPSATKLEIGDEWFAIGLSTNEPERFQGHHADHILLIVDEASGVDEKIFEAAEGFLTAAGAKMLLIGNPTRVGGQFYNAFSRDKANWSTIHIAVTDSPNYTGEPVPANVARSLPRQAWAEEKAAAWGVDSPMYQVRVLGNFPKNADNVVMPLGDVEAAQARDLGAPTDLRAVISCDVARYGDDETVIVERVGNRVRIVEAYMGKPTTHTAARIMHWADQHNAAMRVIVVDDSGVGGGVVDQLKAGGYSVVPFNGANKPRRTGDFRNRRSEVWFEAAAMLEDLDLDPDEQLAADLTSPEYSYDLKQHRVVEAKDATKKRLGRSPDRADAVCMALSMRLPVPDTRPPVPRDARTRSITAGLLDEPL